MIWLFALLTLVVLVVIVLAALPLQIPREPDREGWQDAEASLAYDKTSRWLIFAIERRIILKRLSRFQLKGRLLDIGCGPGYLAAGISRSFPNLRVTGLDISPDMVSIARGNWGALVVGDLDFIQADAAALPFPDNSVDFVVSSLSLHHWNDPVAVLREIHRVLVRGGSMLVFDPRRDSPRIVMWSFAIGQALFAPHAIRITNGAVGSLWASYTAAELKEMLSAASFEKMKVHSGLAWVIGEVTKPDQDDVRSVSESRPT